ncbi:MAG: pantoate--beta-alanine ligase [Gammaproteobacteria bacterium]|nr:pantoate--beta-alanine ligase [Gammaproteobacteria bacterium]
MRIIERIEDLRAALAGEDRTALVPTMGNLHAGHLSLLGLAAGHGGPVVVSIFVNRLQFGPNEDFDRYPRTFEPDCAALERHGCDILFAPREPELYPRPQQCFVQPRPALADVLEGHFRPGFFVGVCTVVIKLFHAVQPRVAVFGKKDYQQLLVVRDMVEQLSMSVRIVAGETVREADGLAMSSRNGFLGVGERTRAPQLHAALRRIADAVRTGQRNWASLEAAAAESLASSGWAVDYVAVRRSADLGPPCEGTPLVALAAGRLGNTRLIDNLEIAPGAAD